MNPLPCESRLISTLKGLSNCLLGFQFFELLSWGVLIQNKNHGTSLGNCSPHHSGGIPIIPFGNWILLWIFLFHQNWKSIDSVRREVVFVYTSHSTVKFFLTKDGSKSQIYHVFCPICYPFPWLIIMKSNLLPLGHKLLQEIVDPSSRYFCKFYQYLCCNMEVIQSRAHTVKPPNNSDRSSCYVPLLTAFLGPYTPENHKMNRPEPPLTYLV